MLRCKHVAEALTDENFYRQPLWRRLAIRMHIAMCFVCGTFHRQLIKLHEAEYRFLTREDEGTGQDDVGLPQESRSRIARAIDAARRAGPPGQEAE